MSVGSGSAGGHCSLRIVAFLKHDELYPRLKDLVERVCQEGHKIMILGEQLLPIFDSHPGYTPTKPYSTPEEFLKHALPLADVLILLTSNEDLLHDIPAHISGMMKKCFKNQGYYSWSAYGFTCLLIGGSVHSRKVAMNLRQLLDDSDYPFFGRVLPEPCSFDRCYDVDPALETSQPCVL